jgi:hypothetical protein
MIGEAEKLIGAGEDKMGQTVCDDGTPYLALSTGSTLANALMITGVGKWTTCDLMRFEASRRQEKEPR